MNNFDKIFSRYSNVMNREMDRYVEEIGQNENKGPQDNDIEKVLNRILEHWLDTPMADVEGKSPKEIIVNIDNLEEALEAFRSFVTIGEGIVPDVLRSKLEEFGTAAIDAMLNILADEAEPSKTNETDFHPYFYVRQGIISLMGIWKAERSIPALLEEIRKSSDKDEFLAEAAVNALVEIGEASVQPLIDESKSATEELKIEYFDALTLIGSKNKDNRIFSAVKEYFLNTDNRDMALAFFEQLNDSRAITFLRGYIEKNTNKIAYREFSSIISCIRELGGSTEDIHIDFADDPEYRDYLRMIKYSNVKEKDTGRNDPCPCGSGKKHKKCCGK